MAPNFVDPNEVYSTKNVKPEDIKVIQEWAESQPHLPKINEIDTLLFLHSCHCSNEAAKQCIDTFYSLRTHSPEFFKDIDPRNIPNIYSTTLYTVLPQQTRDGYQILFGHFIDPKASAYNFDSQVRCMDMASMLALHQKGPAEGFILLHDLKGLSLGHLTRINLLHLKKFFMYLQDALPVRLKGLHFINIVPFIDKIMAMIRPFLKEELKEFIYFHQDFEAMQKYVDLECLPSDYGGKAPCIQELKKQSEENIQQNVNFFLDMQGKLVDESKRPGKPKNAGDFFGVEGTFKKLDID